jgi:hypothetical protein
VMILASVEVAIGVGIFPFLLEMPVRTDGA